MDELRSENWDVATRAAKRLREAPGEAVTVARVEALDAHDTAITEAAAESLILRNEPSTADRMWEALTTLDQDVTNHIWDVISDSLPEHPVS